MSNDASDLRRNVLPTSGQPIHQTEPYVIVKFDPRTTPDLKKLYDISIDRYDEATKAELEIIKEALPSAENLPRGGRDQPVMSFRRVFESVSWEEMERLKSRVVNRPEGDTVPEMPALETFFRIGFKEPRPTRQQLPRNQPPIWERSECTPDVVATTLGGCKHVERAFVGCSIGVPPALLLERGEVRSHDHDAIGLSAFREMAEFSGAAGQGTQFVDIEQGWEYRHHALPELTGAIPISGVNRNWIWSNKEGKWVNVGLHGLMVLGLVAGKYGLGIAPGTTPYLASEWKKPIGQPWTENTAEAIVAALMVLRAGDVILIEGQQVYSEVNLPVEADEMIFEAIVAAHNLGITVVEAAGNNVPEGQNLDDVTLPGDRKLFEKDSGAICVAAGVNPGGGAKFTRSEESNYGTKIHCFADGDSLLTLDIPGPGGDRAGDYVVVEGGGTSSASAIVAGVALVLQGLVQQGEDAYIHPWDLREMLRDDQNGRKAAPIVRDESFEEIAEDPLIGVMPSLAKLGPKIKDLKLSRRT